MTRAKIILSDFIVVSVLLLIFQSPLALALPGALGKIIQSYDEIFTAVLSFLLLLRVMKIGFPKSYMNEAAIFILFIVVGIACTWIHHLQGVSAVMEDLVSCSKFVLCILSLKLTDRWYSAKRVLSVLQTISKWLILMFFLLTVFDLALPGRLFPAGSIRYGLHSVQLFYYHYAVLAQVMVLLLALISFDSDIKYVTYYKFAALFVIAMTLRTKTFGFVLIYLFIWGYQKVDVKRLKVVLVLVALAVVYLVGIGSLQKYYGVDTTARMMLTSDSLDIASENFPLGLGFGTFGSAAAAKYYSPVYKELGYETRYGLGYVNTNYATDTFWPVLLAQFGYLGTLLYGSYLWMLSSRVIRLFKINKNAGLATASVLAYLFVSSTAGTAFFNPIAILCSVVLGFGLSLYPDETETQRQLPPASE